MRVLAAMSGGVDSAVAAARAVDAGHDVTGVHLALSRTPGTLRTGSRGCCTIEDSRDAWRAADVLGIPYYVWDFSERFQAEVVDDFVAEYAAGRTPNPCLRCNERIKFAALLDKALALGFDAVCTGHYAKLVEGPGGARELHRAADRAKDQSYVLGVLTAEQLDHVLLPLADAPAKAEVRAEAARRGLSVAAKPDSHDICFIPDGDTRGWLAERIEPAEGEIRDVDGTVVGTHPGAHAFTVGQRRGLRIGTPAPDGKPRFVLEIRPRTNEVVVGPEALLAVDELRGIRPSWAGAPVPQAAALLRDGRAGDASASFPVSAQVRAHGDPVPARARLELVDGPGGEPVPELVARLGQPVRGVAPGQSLVLYRGTRVLGQATVDRTRPPERPGAARPDPTR